MDKKEEELLAYRRTHPLYLPRKVIIIIFFILMGLYLLNLLFDFILNKPEKIISSPQKRINPTMKPVISPKIIYPTSIETTTK